MLCISPMSCWCVMLSQGSMTAKAYSLCRRLYMARHLVLCRQLLLLPARGLAQELSRQTRLAKVGMAAL